MLEPLKERTRDTCETRIRGGPPEATGLSLVTQPRPSYSASASPVQFRESEILNRPFVLRRHVTLFYENESYVVFSSKND